MIRSPIRDSQFTTRAFRGRALLLLALLVAPACAGRRQPVFAPAAREDAERAIAAWSEAVARADAGGPAHLLYEARVSQGPFRTTGTLAVRQGPRSVEATLAGPFGDALARYSDGALRGDGIRPIAIEQEELRWLLAGAWKGRQPPLVAGTDGSGTNALLRWDGPEQVEAVLAVPSARFRSLQVRRRDGAIAATYPDDSAGRPRRIDLKDLASGNTLRLTLLAAEPEE